MDNERDDKLTRCGVDAVYKQYEDFIVIGLTGRCGSGCSTVRDAFSKTGDMVFEPGSFLPQSITNNEDRDLNNIVSFAIEKKVLPFQVIKVRDILTSYLLENIWAFAEILSDLYSVEFNENELVNCMKECHKKSFNTDPGDNYQMDGIMSMCKRIWENLDKDTYSQVMVILLEDYNFLFEKLPVISDGIREYLKSIDKDAYTIVYQYIGNSVRTYGSFINSGEKQEGIYVHSIAKRINSLIKLLRRQDWIKKSHVNNDTADKDDIVKMHSYSSPVRVVIDSIKNVFEADYLKSRYHSFYLLAVTLDENMRQFRLKERKGLSDKQINIIDCRERPEKAQEEIKKREKAGESSSSDDYIDEYLPKDYKNLQYNSLVNGTYRFNLQDVDACIQKADIFINNNKNEDDLKKHILRYACLMMHPGLVPPTDDERCMQIAQAAKVNSGCISRQVGAVICDSSNNIVSIGWNDVTSTDNNECVSCVRRNLKMLCSKEDVYAYSYFELQDKDYRDYIKKIIILHLEEKMKHEKAKNSLENLSLNDLYRLFKSFYNNNLDGLTVAYCFKDVYCASKNEKNQIHTRAQHAEERAFEHCDKQRTKGGTLYTTSSSCELCAKKALSYSINRIVYIEPYPGLTKDHVLGHKVKYGNGSISNKPCDGEWITPIKVELFTGATNNAYIQLYSPIFPLKDELVLRGIHINKTLFPKTEEKNG